MRQGPAKHLISALFLALMLVVQSVSGLMAQSNAPQLDAFGNPLCISNSVSDDTPSHDKTRQQDCCTMRCCAISVVAQVVPTTDAIAIDFEVVAIVRKANLDVLVVHPTRREPGNPRGPPHIV